MFWYYTPMALSFTSQFSPVAAVYDCMDELSAFKGAHSRLQELRESDSSNMWIWFSPEDRVCTKRSVINIRQSTRFPAALMSHILVRPESLQTDPEDQASIPHPRLGFFGVIDERFDIELLDSVATSRPDWHFVMIGPVVKIDPDSLPKHPNIHYLGPKKYDELPDYLAGWDIALLLFARNESTRFISPTKTPEYLAAGKPVISTSIRDVVRPYGELELVQIADTAADFVRAAEEIVGKLSGERLSGSRELTFLADMSWDKTWGQMSLLLDQVIQARRAQKCDNRDRRAARQRAATAVSP